MYIDRRPPSALVVFCVYGLITPCNVVQSRPQLCPVYTDFGKEIELYLAANESEPLFRENKVVHVTLL